MNSPILGLRVASVAFGLITMAQLARLLIRPQMLINGYEMPLWPSILAVIILGSLSLWMWKLARHLELIPSVKLAAEKNDFERQVDLISVELSKMLEAHHEKSITDSREWLESLFKHYSDRMLSDNERIWRTGALFVPIALAAFAALTAIKSLQLWHILVLGAPSISLMWAWIVIAENHRAFQQKSEAWLIAIQRTMDLDAPRQVKVEAGGREAWVTGKGAIQNMRWNLLGMVVLAWIVILICYVCGVISAQCVP